MATFPPASRIGLTGETNAMSPLAASKMVTDCSLTIVGVHGRISVDGVRRVERLPRHARAVRRNGELRPNLGRWRLRLPQSSARGGHGHKIAFAVWAAADGQNLLLRKKVVVGLAVGVNVAKHFAAAGEVAEVQNPLHSAAAQILKVADGIDGQMNGGPDAADQHHLARVAAQNADHEIGWRLHYCRSCRRNPSPD